MPDYKRYDYRDETPGDGLRLVAVEKKIRAAAIQFEKNLCANGGVTLERLHEHLALHTISEVDDAIKRWGPKFESHLGTTDLDTPRDSEASGGWIHQWELAEAEREEARRADMQRRADITNGGKETE